MRARALLEFGDTSRRRTGGGVELLQRIAVAAQPALARAACRGAASRCAGVAPEHFLFLDLALRHHVQVEAVRQIEDGLALQAEVAADVLGVGVADLAAQRVADVADALERRQVDPQRGSLLRKMVGQPMMRALRMPSDQSTSAV